MIKNFYANQRRKHLNFDGHKTKMIFSKINLDNIKKNSKDKTINVDESNSYRVINNKKSDGYVYHGKSKLFKIINIKFSSENPHNTVKTQILLNKINKDKFFFRNLSNNKDMKTNNNFNSVPKFNKELSENILLNNMTKNTFHYRKINQKFNNINSNKCRTISKNINKDNNSIEDNLNIQYQNLKQLHKNFMHSIKNKKLLFNNYDLFDAYDENIFNKKIVNKINSQKILKKSKISLKKINKSEKGDINKVRVIKNNFSTKNNIKSFLNNKINIKHNKIIKDNNSINNEENSKINLKNNTKENIIKENNENKTISPKNSKTNFIPKFDFIFSNPNKNRNFSFNSKKNMKVTEDYSKINTIKEEKDQTEKSKIKLNYKTATNFFSPKFKKKFETNSLNIKEIINGAIANNIKKREAVMSSSFYNIGINYLNNKARKTKNNFYSSSYDKNWKKEKIKEEINKEENNKSKYNSLKLFLLESETWEKHENIWINIKQKLEEKNEIFILPPNDDDILLSSYVKIYGKNNNNLIKNYDKEKKYFCYCINDDNMINPRNEIKKWKNIYKNSLLRWHPDKLFSLITELNIKNRSIIECIYKRANNIINNINIMYQNIIEILNKILLNQK